MSPLRTQIVNNFSELRARLGLSERHFGLKYAHDDKFFKRLRGDELGIRLTTIERMLEDAQRDAGAVEISDRVVAEERYRAELAADAERRSRLLGIDTRGIRLTTIERAQVEKR